MLNNMTPCKTGALINFSKHTKTKCISYFPTLKYKPFDINLSYKLKNKEIDRYQLKLSVCSLENELHYPNHGTQDYSKY